MSTQTISKKSIEEMDEIAVRFAGDSGDGMQLAGTQFTTSSAIFGNDISTFPDFPAEIRAPAGSLAGVSGFQINFSNRDIHTPGDAVNALVALNPAALRTKYQLYKVPISRLTREALTGSALGAKAADRCKNFFALGLVYWLYGRSMDPTLRWIEQKFSKSPDVAEANTKTLKAGYYFGETCEFFPVQYKVSKAKLPPGKYRKISGNEAVAMGVVTAAHIAGKELFYASYPITPASDILHALSRRKNFGVKTFQAEDEIAAMAAALGAAFAGDIAVTGTSGPGLALKAEAIGLGVMTELPVVIIDVQRGGPSTGLPTKTEQADLLQAMYGRNGECPVCVLAASSPGDCFHMAVEAVRIATQHMTPVILLTDGYIGNGEEPWLIPSEDSLPRIEIKYAQPRDGHEFHPYERNEHLVRPWAIPGTPKLQHRIGGLEKQDITGNVSYDPDNHERMVRLRAKKVATIAHDIPELTVLGPESGDLLVVGWGGTSGAIRSAVERVQKKGHSVACAHLRYLNPMPRNTSELLKRYKRVLVPELNMGQLRHILRAEYLVDAIGYNKIKGKPFLISELEKAIMENLPKGGAQ
jgi:2-oxoglutarate ferredoxin oxidoreductase subunit alpha